MWVAVVVVYLCVLCVLIGSLLIKRKHAETPLLDTRRNSRIARLQMNKQPIKEKLEVYLRADD